MSNYAQQFDEMIRSNEDIMRDLLLVRDLDLPDAYIAAGYVRNYIWDCLHGYAERTPLNDIDVIYYDPVTLDEEMEKQVEQKLHLATGCTLWSVKNQARMHLQNGDPPYGSVLNAINHWPETVTAIAIRLEADGRLTWLCPYGLANLFEYRVTRSPLFLDEAYYQSRISRKNWKELWPRLLLK